MSTVSGWVISHAVQMTLFEKHFFRAHLDAQAAAFALILTHPHQRPNDLQHVRHNDSIV